MVDVPALDTTTVRRPRTVVALGGNAIIRRDDNGTYDSQIKRAQEAMVGIADLAESGHVLILTHGNGPVVGNILLRGEAAAELVPPMPLYVAGADSGGGIGFLLQQTLHNELATRGLTRPVATIVTQTIVDAEDPAFKCPTKPIGPYLDEKQAQDRIHEQGWVIKEQPSGGWRRVVASPLPQRIVEAEPIVALAESGSVIIAAGGGGVPVTESDEGQLHGVDAVVDKDWAGALLACELEADTYVILMESDGLYRSWDKPDQECIEELDAGEARELLISGALDQGTIGPKIAAAAYAAESCGCISILCAADSLAAALLGESGTRITAG